MARKTMTALIVGAGAVENAWRPVLRALGPLYDFPLTEDGANCLLARVVYLLRWYSYDNSETGKVALAGLKKSLGEIKSAICTEIDKSEKKEELRVRKEFSSIVDEMLVKHSTTFMLVTTNWDNVVDRALSRHLGRTMNAVVRPLHIHGSTDSSDILYLPTEMTKEPYRANEEEQRIGGIHGSIWRGLENAHRVVIYGLSLSPLDAELGQTLAAGWSNNNLREISIVSPAHGVVAQRVNLLLDPRRKVTVRGHEPQNLKEETDYTIERESQPLNEGPWRRS